MVVRKRPNSFLAGVCLHFPSNVLALLPHLPPFSRPPHGLGRVIAAWLGLVTSGVFELMALCHGGIGVICLVTSTCRTVVSPTTDL